MSTETAKLTDQSFKTGSYNFHVILVLRNAVRLLFVIYGPFIIWHTNFTCYNKYGLSNLIQSKLNKKYVIMTLTDSDDVHSDWHLHMILYELVWMDTFNLSHRWSSRHWVFNAAANYKHIFLWLYMCIYII